LAIEAARIGILNPLSGDPKPMSGSVPLSEVEAAVDDIAELPGPFLVDLREYSDRARPVATSSASPN
jgi:hypothetical protein